MMSWKECEQALLNKCNHLSLQFPLHSFNYGKMGRSQQTDYKPMWGSVFVANVDGVQIGRLIFKDGVFDHSKIYGLNKGLVRRTQVWDMLEAAVK